MLEPPLLEVLSLSGKLTTPLDDVGWSFAGLVLALRDVKADEADTTLLSMLFSSVGT